MPLTSPFTLSSVPTSLFVATKDYDPKVVRMQRMFKLNVYLPPLNRLRSRDKAYNRKNTSSDMHMNNVGIVGRRTSKNVSFLADVHILGESTRGKTRDCENFVLKSCLKQKN